MKLSYYDLIGNKMFVKPISVSFTDGLLKQLREQQGERLDLLLQEIQSIFVELSNYIMDYNDFI